MGLAKQKRSRTGCNPSGAWIKPLKGSTMHNVIPTAHATFASPAESVALILDAATGAALDEVALAAAVDEALAVANAGNAHPGLALAEAVAVALDVHLGDFLDDERFSAAVDDVVDAIARHAARG
jgi:hypothetical protein